MGDAIRQNEDLMAYMAVCRNGRFRIVCFSTFPAGAAAKAPQ
jgi:hypothetical protein